jgi:hypothetical protein
MSSHEATFDAVCRRVAEFGNRASLITVGEQSTPHVVSVVVGIADGHLIAKVGPRTRSNLLARPTLSLLSTPAGNGEYHLILDGAATDLGAVGTDGICEISIDVSGGILHRLADLPGDGPSCIVLGDDSYTNGGTPP